MPLLLWSRQPASRSGTTEFVELGTFEIRQLEALLARETPSGTANDYIKNILADFEIELVEPIHHLDGTVPIDIDFSTETDASDVKRQLLDASKASINQPTISLSPSDLPSDGGDSDAVVEFLTSKLGSSTGKRITDRFSPMEALLGEGGQMPDNPELLLPTDLLFELNEWELKEEARLGLMKLGMVILHYPEATFKIKGFTDSIGSQKYNLDLSQKRAEAVRDWLGGSLQLENFKIEAVGYGKLNPLVEPTGDKDEEALSRRVEIEIINKLEIQPLGMKGYKAGQTRNFEGIEFVWCPTGIFSMGSPDSEPGRSDDEQLHEVLLTQGFWLGQFEVTQAEWVGVMETSVVQQATKMLQDDTLYQVPSEGQLTLRALVDASKDSDPSKFVLNRDPVRPMIHVNWNDAVAYCEQLTNRARNNHTFATDWEFRLPTEAEWEYACRASTETPFTSV